jgi:DNA-binding NarL/FixJ family response regulator
MGAADDAITIAVVDDVEPVRVLLRSWISDHPELVLVGEAADGQSALDLIDERHPAAVVLDVELPDMNGLEVLRAIKQAQPATVVAMYSSSPKARPAAVALGADLFFTKGHPLDDILRSILAAVARRAA